MPIWADRTECCNLNKYLFCRVRKGPDETYAQCVSNDYLSANWKIKPCVGRESRTSSTTILCHLGTPSGIKHVLINLKIH